MAYITLRDGGHSIQAALVTAIAVCFGKGDRKIKQKRSLPFVYVRE
jgi:hypothetical protein